MVANLNPGDNSAAESDYDKKFNRIGRDDANNKKIKDQEAAGDTDWKTSVSKAADKPDGKKGRFGFKGRHAGKLRKGSAFGFIIAFIGLGIWYTSFLAPNILLVNMKEMYTNDLADSTTALEIYTQIMYFNKIGPLAGQDCVDGQPMSAQPIKCKLTTMSRSQKEAFERQGFIFGFGNIELGGTKINADLTAKKVYEDNRDDGDFRNDKEESRWKVYAILPPNYTQVIDSVKAGGMTSVSSLLSGNTGAASKKISDTMTQLLNPLKDASQSPQSMLNSMLSYAPITSGPQLWLYSQLSSVSKAQVFGVFHPKSSFFSDERYKERTKSRYNTTKRVTVSGKTEQQVNKSFDNSVQKGDGGIDPLTGQPNPTDGVSLSSLSSPLSLTQLQSLAGQLTSGGGLASLQNVANQLPMFADLQVAGNLLATNTYSYTDLMCSWYTIGKISNNALIRAKASTAARYALQYLKAADAIKAGTSEEVPTNVLASKLAQHSLGGYNGGSATDSLIYRSITFGDIIPNSPGELGSLISDPSKLLNAATDIAAIVAYNLSAYENIGTMAASWLQIIPNAAALGSVVGASGSLMPPPANVGGSDREYCLSGETMENKTTTKGESTNTTKCLEAVTAMAPVGTQAAVAEAAEIGRRTCPPLNLQDDNLVQGFMGTWRGPVSNTMLPSQKLTQITLTPYVAAWFGTNTMLVSAATQQLYTSQIKGIAANYALFSGMGELLGDMAMSRGLMPSNIADMTAYLLLGEAIGVQDDLDDVDRYYAQKDPFDPYNKFSFVGSLVRQLSPTVNDQSPLFATLSNVLSLVGTSAKQLGQVSSANAFYHIQPSLLTGENPAERLAGYMMRLSSAFCPIDIEYLSIGIMPDMMCNVRYSMPLEDIGIALNLGGVIDYMTQSHSDMYQSKIDELTERVGKADIEGNKEFLSVQLADAQSASEQPFIDKNTGKPTPGSEYEKYLQYCVNRLDPWGRSAIGVRYDGLTNDQKRERVGAKDANGEALDRNDPGDPNQKYAGGIPTMAVTANQSDLDWYTGKKCTRMGDQQQMLSYFRVFTTLCSVDGSMSGIIDCTEPDQGENYSDPFYLNNDILYTSWY